MRKIPLSYPIPKLVIYGCWEKWTAYRFIGAWSTRNPIDLQSNIFLREPSSDIRIIDCLIRYTSIFNIGFRQDKFFLSNFDVNKPWSQKSITAVTGVPQWFTFLWFLNQNWHLKITFTKNMIFIFFSVTWFILTDFYVPSEVTKLFIS